MITESTEIRNAKRAEKCFFFLTKIGLVEQGPRPNNNKERKLATSGPTCFSDYAQTGREAWSIFFWVNKEKLRVFFVIEVRAFIFFGQRSLEP